MKRDQHARIRQHYVKTVLPTKKKARSLAAVPGVRGVDPSTPWFVDTLDQAIKDTEHLNARLRWMENALSRDARLEEVGEKYRPRGRQGLIEYVRETGDIDAVGVQEEILTLQHEQLHGETLNKRKKAASILVQVGTALKGVGRGRTQELSPEDKTKSQRAAVARSKAVKRLFTNFGKWRKHYSVEQAYRQTVEDFKAKNRITNSHQITLILKAFDKRIEALG
jgi:hypothetical protein